MSPAKFSLGHPCVDCLLSDCGARSALVRSALRYLCEYICGQHMHAPINTVSQTLLPPSESLVLRLRDRAYMKVGPARLCTAETMTRDIFALPIKTTVEHPSSLTAPSRPTQRNEEKFNLLQLVAFQCAPLLRCIAHAKERCVKGLSFRYELCCVTYSG